MKPHTVVNEFGALHSFSAFTHCLRSSLVQFTEGFAFALLHFPVKSIPAIFAKSSTPSGCQLETGKAVNCVGF